MDGWLGPWKNAPGFINGGVFYLKGEIPMTIHELQKWVYDDWHKRSKVMPSVELQLLYIMEELGEVAEAIRKASGSKTRKQAEVDLGSELADLLVSITTLANHFEVDIEKEITLFQSRLAKRHQEGF